MIVLTNMKNNVIVNSRNKKSKQEKGNIMTLQEARREAKELNVKFGKLTSDRDSQGEGTLYEDGAIVSEGWYGTANEAKADYIESEMYERIED